MNRISIILLLLGTVAAVGCKSSSPSREMDDPGKSSAVSVTGGSAQAEATMPHSVKGPGDKSAIAALQGEWRGTVFQGDTRHSCTFAVNGSNFEFHDTGETNVWYKGTFVLTEDILPKHFTVTIAESAFPQYQGKSSVALYQLEHGTLTITANEPGSGVIPKSLNDPESVRMEVRRK